MTNIIQRAARRWPDATFYFGLYARSALDAIGVGFFIDLGQELLDNHPQVKRWIADKLGFDSLEGME